VRELEQAARRILLSGRYQGESPPASRIGCERLLEQMNSGTLNAKQVLASYCALLYQRFGTYEQVARITELDRRTVKKQVLAADGNEQQDSV
jgi:hypothetical protein